MKRRRTCARTRSKPASPTGPGSMSPEEAANWRWFVRHYAQVERGRQGQLVAIGMCRILAWGKNADELERRALRLAGHRPVIYHFVAPDNAIYADRAEARPKTR